MLTELSAIIEGHGFSRSPGQSAQHLDDLLAGFRRQLCLQGGGERKACLSLAQGEQVAALGAELT